MPALRAMQPEPKRNALWIAIFVILSASLTLPFFFVHEPPLLDYPNHLARTFVLSHIHDPAFTFSKYYQADWKPYPYILWDGLMVALQQFLPVERAGKLLLIINTALLPIAVAWFLWQANRTEIRLALLGCALSYYTLFLWGFTQYQLGVSLCFLMLGTWLWYGRKPSAWRAAMFAVISIATYSGSCARVCVGGIHPGALRTHRLQLARIVAACLLPRSIVAAVCVGPSRTFSAEPFRYAAHHGKVRCAEDRWRPWGMTQRLENIFLAGLVLCLLLAIVRNRELRVNWRWLVAAIGLFLIFLLLPDAWGESFDIDVRLVPPLWLLSLAVLRVGRRARWIALLAIALVAVRVLDITRGFQSESVKSVAMNDGIEHLSMGARIFPLVDTCKDDDPLDDYYIHYWAYSVIRRGAISPYLFDVPGQTPMRITYDAYTPPGYWDHCYDEEPDWQARRKRLRLHMELWRQSIPGWYRSVRKKNLRQRPRYFVSTREALNKSRA